MQRIFIDNHDRILCYGNPAGYITEKEAVVDTMFQTQELESFLQKQALSIRWEDGVYDRLLLGSICLIRRRKLRNTPCTGGFR